MAFFSYLEAISCEIKLRFPLPVVHRSNTQLEWDLYVYREGPLQQPDV